MPRLTLAAGGAGIVLASLIPLRSRLILLVRPPDASWLNDSWSPPFQYALSTTVLVIAFVILAVGIGKESGITGSSTLGKVALISYPVTLLALSLQAVTPLPTLDPGSYTGATPPATAILTTPEVAGSVLTAVGLAALVVASIIVVRAFVAHGLARWGLLILALACLVAVGAQAFPLSSPVVIEIARWALIGAPTIQLALGVVYIICATTTGARHPLPTRMQ